MEKRKVRNERGEVAGGQWPVVSGQWSVFSVQCSKSTHYPLPTIHFFFFFIFLSFFNFLNAQSSLPARANVTPYYDEAAVEKLAYRESPYYLELTGSWQQRQTDSSVRYMRQLEAEKNWKDYRVFLNVRAGHTVRVLLNDKEVGCGDDSRHWNEFLLTPYLRYDRANTLTIETLKQAKGALLEDASLQVGLNGEPYLLFKNDPNVADFTLVADYDAATTMGTLTLSANVFCSKRKGKYYVEVELWNPRGRNFDRMGRWVVFNGKNEETIDISRSWSDVLPWNSEEPNLYTAVIRLRNEKMEEEETVGARFGFRRVEVKDGVLQLNGKAITLKGVTYGLEHTEGYASRLQMQRDIESMKLHNINAVRTARYSPMDAWFYELCDRYGLYVICDANLLPLSEQRQAVATDQEYMPLFEHRVENLYGKYKNHTSIIAWSLGNTRDNAVCMTAAYKRLKAKEKNRPVIFSGADHGDATDIIALQLPELPVLRQSLKRQGERPCLLLTSVDRAHFADLEPLWQVVEGNRQLQGGFVDAWPLDAVSLSELSHLYSPFDVKLDKLTPDEGEFIVFNRNDFAPFGRYSLDYNIFTNLRPAITGGELPAVPPCGGSDKVSMRIPPLDLQAGEEPYIRFTLKSRETARPTLRGTVEFPLPQKSSAARMLVGEGASLDTVSALRPVQLSFVGHEDWRVDTVERAVRRPDERTLCVDYMLRYALPSGATMCYVRTTATRFSTGDVVYDYTLLPGGRPCGKLQPVVKMALPDADSVTWYGLDREVRFAKRNSGLMGIYSQRVTSGMLSREQVRWCVAGGMFMRLLDQRCTMRVRGGEVSLMSQPGERFRLHMRRCDTDNPASYLGVDYPEYPSTMQPPVEEHRSMTNAAIASVTFSRRANTPYNIGADSILFDGEKGSVDDLSRGWLGFSGEAVVTTVRLAQAVDVNHVTLRYAHTPATWAFAPRKVVLTFSADGTTYGDSVVAVIPIDPSDEEDATPGVVEVDIPVGKEGIGYIRITPETIGVIPAWHRAKGLKPWLLMDEIEID